jgi:hypothetical protein
VKSSLRDWGVFALVQVTVCLAVYGSALWGARILAPLDIAPAIFPAYKFVDPTSNGIPDNHYIIDQLTYDLPLQHVIYDAYRRGEIPWWDPYTYGGRPLLADAHINGTDPIRILCYLTLPFVLAYNWNLILHSIVAAAGMFILLRFWRFGLFTCTTLAIAWQFSGAFVMHFGHPWIAGTFVWFPFIWICWERALARGFSSVRNITFAALLCAASFYSGNLQSHLYLPLFALVFLIGHFITSWQASFRVMTVLATSGILGAALAAPVLANQVEFFLLSTREVAMSLEWWKHPTKLLLSLGGVFPWATGTFRTLDIGRIVRSAGTAWFLFCGSATFVLALVGLFARRAVCDSQRPLLIISMGLVAIYLIIIGSPLTHIFYLRVAPLAILGLVPLAAIGLTWLASVQWVVRPKVALVTAIGALTTVAVINAGALLAYPAVKSQLTQAALAADSSNKSFPAAPALRKFQVENFPSEVSLLNPETLLSLVGLLFLSGAIGTASAQYRRNLAYCAITISLLPLLGFANRFIPDHPIEMLEHLQAGGPTQLQAIELVQFNNGRILDPDMQVFPYAMGVLYRVHTIHGYSALHPPSIFRYSDSISLPTGYGADFMLHFLGNETMSVESLSLRAPMGRFTSENGQQIDVVSETLNSLTLHSPNGALTAFSRTDTPYPGWTASPDKGVTTARKEVSTLFDVRTKQPTSEILLTYTPTYLRSTSIVAFLAALLVLITLLLSFLLPKKCR